MERLLAPNWFQNWQCVVVFLKGTLRIFFSVIKQAARYGSPSMLKHLQTKPQKGRFLFSVGVVMQTLRAWVIRLDE